MREERLLVVLDGRDRVKVELANRLDDHRRLDHQHVQDIYELYGDASELRRDGRPRLELIWKDMYGASLFASGTHYIIFDDIQPRTTPVIDTLGSCGYVFFSGSTAEHNLYHLLHQQHQHLLLKAFAGSVYAA